MAMFTEGQRLEVTDQTGKPCNRVQEIQVLIIERMDEPEYFVAISNPDYEDIIKNGLMAYTSYWQLDKAVREGRISVRVLD